MLLMSEDGSRYAYFPTFVSVRIRSLDCYRLHSQSASVAGNVMLWRRGTWTERRRDRDGSEIRRGLAVLGNGRRELDSPNTSFPKRLGVEVRA